MAWRSLKGMQEAIGGADGARGSAGRDESVGRGGCRRDNARIYLTGCVGKAQTVATRDPADRAHLARDARGFLLPAAAVGSARPRRYPACYITGRGVACDSAFDETYRIQLELARAGIDLGMGTRCDAGGHAELRIRDLIRPRTRQVPRLRRRE